MSSNQNYLFPITIILFLFAPAPVFSTSVHSHDSLRVIKKFSKCWPVITKGDYRRFYKIYSDDAKFKFLAQGKDSSQVQDFFGRGAVLDSDLYDLTFQMGHEGVNYALSYKVNYNGIKCKIDEWYLSQFAIIFDGDGKAGRIFDHQARGYTLFDKRKRKAI